MTQAPESSRPQYRPMGTQRRPIGTPSMATSWRNAVRRRFSEQHSKGIPVGASPGWIRIVEQRNAISIIIAACIAGYIAYLGDEIFSSQSDNMFTRILNDLVYAVMIFATTAQVSKQMMGIIHNTVFGTHHRWHPAQTARSPGVDARVAILFPVYHEDAARVVAGMASMWESLLRDAPEYAHRYDFFLLSDSRDTGHRIAEQSALQRLSHAHPTGRFFYRWRINNAHAKLGNMVDWCRRWGNQYKYMAVMDADSLMSGHALHTMLRMMEGNQRIGILQTNPMPILRTSLFGRMQQFAGRLYGAVFAYSLQSMYMGHANYIGHNAMIRTEPFIAHCMLPDLPGASPWGGKPLSHDVAEAAMMAKAGYEVWFLPEIEGSYEETPANILGHLIRQRRWMQGNLQHIRLVCIEGIRNLHRENFIIGFMTYASAGLWAIFLANTLYTQMQAVIHPSINRHTIHNLRMPMLMLLGATLAFTLLPRVLAIAMHIPRHKAAPYGGLHRIVVSIVLETVASIPLSTINIIYVCKFLLLWAQRKGITWGTQQRDDTPLTWGESMRHFGWISIIGLMVSAGVLYVVQETSATRSALMGVLSGNLINIHTMLWWLSPLAIATIGAPVIAQVTSRTYTYLGTRGIFSIPEELHVPQEISDMQRWDAMLRTAIPDATDTHAMLCHARQDPHFMMDNLKRLRNKPHVAARIIPKIRSNTPLNNEEMGWAIREQSCFQALRATSTTRH